VTARQHLATRDDAALGVPPAEEIRLLDFLRILVTERKLTLGVPLLFAAVAGLASLVLPQSYSAEAKFVPEAKQPALALPGALATLAGAQLGLALGGNQYGPEFYAQLVTSRNILDTLLVTPFKTSARDSAVKQRLVDILPIRGQTEAKRLERGARKLREDWISTSVALSTGVVTLRVELRDPVLAASVANEILAQLQRFNTQTRQFQARERARFAGDRAGEAARELGAAEDALKAFLERNLRYEESPRLRFEYDRLQRQINLAQESYLSLRREYDKARVDEVNDTPVLTIIDRARPPQRPAWPLPWLFILVAFLVGAMVGVTGALSREAVRRLRQREDPDYRILASEWSRLKGRLAGLLARRR
jgi:uncharacterized protein involved in exopolysaccharide biosynthesis